MKSIAKAGSRGASAAKAAPGPETPIKISFLLLECVETQGEGSPDEPYVVFFVADLGAGFIAKTMVRGSGVFRDVDDGETHKRLDRHKHPPAENPLVLWGIDGKPAPIKNPDEVVILVALMENDKSSPEAVVNAV